MCGEINSLTHCFYYNDQTNLTNPSGKRCKKHSNLYFIKESLKLYFMYLISTHINSE